MLNAKPVQRAGSKQELNGKSSLHGSQAVQTHTTPAFSPKSNFKINGEELGYVTKLQKQPWQSTPSAPV